MRARRPPGSLRVQPQDIPADPFADAPGPTREGCRSRENLNRDPTAHQSWEAHLANVVIVQQVPAPEQRIAMQVDDWKNGLIETGRRPTLAIVHGAICQSIDKPRNASHVATYSSL